MVQLHQPGRGCVRRRQRLIVYFPSLNQPRSVMSARSIFEIMSTHQTTSTNCTAINRTQRGHHIARLGTASHHAAQSVDEARQTSSPDLLIQNFYRQRIDPSPAVPNHKESIIDLVGVCRYLRYYFVRLPTSRLHGIFVEAIEQSGVEP